MKILIWTPPWATQGGDLFFQRNAFRKHLLLQADTLAGCGCAVDVAFPNAFAEDLRGFGELVRTLPLDSMDATTVVGGFRDPSPEFYAQGQTSPLAHRVADWLRPQLSESYDAILLWETPVPYLELLFEDALIVHQMPGAFARAPFPHLVTFDPTGLYRHSALHTEFSAIGAPIDTAFIDAFRTTVRNTLEPYSVIDRDTVLNVRDGADRIALMPLQITDHYAFTVDTGFHSQADLLLAAMKRIPANTVAVATQYISRLYKDEILDNEMVSFIKENYKNFYFDSKFKDIPSVSQFIIKDCDQVVSASSSLIAQALCWDSEITVVGETHYQGFGNLAPTDRASRDAALGFLLERQQPLASEITKNGKFLTQIIEELSARRTRTGLDRFASFNDIHSDYADQALSGFRTAEVARQFSSPKVTVAKTGKEKQFARQIEDGNWRLISFDVFDTLIERLLERPADLYRLLETELRRAGKTLPFDFAAQRLRAELAARVGKGDTEISLDDIYNQFAELSGATQDLLDEARAAEEAIELRLARPRRVGQRVWAEAQRSGLPLCFTSDMYLPKSLIQAMLTRAGYGDETPLFVSSEIGVTKKSGAMFDHIAGWWGIPTKAILHVGDNLRTDVEPAKARGVTPFHVPRAIDIMSSHTKYRDIFRRREPIDDVGRSVTAWLIAQRLFDDPKLASRNELLSEGMRDFGFCLMGPLLFGYVTWLRREAKALGIDVLFFLSREGRIIKDAFDQLEALEPSGIRSVYLYGSRRAIRVAALKSVGDLTEAVSQPAADGVTVARLLSDRFGIDPASISEQALACAGIASANVPVAGLAPGALTWLARSMSDNILERAQTERAVYEAYLDHVGLQTARRPAVVDIGWKANMQGCLGQLIGRPLDGFYFATLEAARRWRDQGHGVHAYYALDVPVTDHAPILVHRLFMEYLWCDSIPSVLRIARNRDGFTPVFNDEKEPPQRIAAAKEAQAGALEFVRMACDAMGSVAVEAVIHPTFADRPMNAFLTNPSTRDAKLFEGHYFEDSFGGLDRGYIVAKPMKSAAQRRARSYWRAGAGVLTKNRRADGADRPERHTKTKTSAPIALLRKKIVLRIVQPFLVRHLNARERHEFNYDPEGLFGRARHPAMVRIGRVAGLI